MATRLVVKVYSRKDCGLCKEVKATIGRVNAEIPFHLKEVDIADNDDLFRRYKEDVPTIFINDKKAFKFKVDEAEFRKMVRKEFIRAGISRIWNKKEQRT